MNLCSVENCGRIVYGNGYCERHYHQIRDYGKILKRTIHDPNEIIIENDICRMKLYNKECEEIAETIFDLKYKKEIEQFKWHLDGYGYVGSNYYNNKQQQKMSLHGAIVELSGQTIKDNEEIDHKDTNPLNNLEINLRICTKSQNQHNKKLQKNNTSVYKGVVWYPKYNKWKAQIMINKKPLFLGYFTIKEDAARAYNAAAIKYHGEFAVLNIII